MIMEGLQIIECIVIERSVRCDEVIPVNVLEIASSGFRRYRASTLLAMTGK